MVPARPPAQTRSLAQELASTGHSGSNVGRESVPRMALRSTATLDSNVGRKSLYVALASALDRLPVMLLLMPCGLEARRRMPSERGQAVDAPRHKDGTAQCRGVDGRHALGFFTGSIETTRWIEASD
jgi:hypothetical protein